jgi:ornithine decarboxylase
MNPVKSEEDVRKAYFDYNVRAFALHSENELDKIVRATVKAEREAQDLELFVRLKVTSRHARLDLNPKFGIAGPPAIKLLQRMKREDRTINICFNVGSQVTDASDYSHAIHEVQPLLAQAEVQARSLSVGGGFGVTYPGNKAPSIRESLEEIETTQKALFKGENMQVLCEPGRALSAESESLVVRVEERRGQELYLNDGVYGRLYDAGKLDWRFEVKLLRTTPSEAEIREFVFWGPTGDSLDYMPGPFLVPDDVREGDYIEIMHTGAYGQVFTSRFNGLGEYGQLVIDDDLSEETTSDS